MLSVEMVLIVFIYMFLFAYLVEAVNPPPTERESLEIHQDPAARSEDILRDRKLSTNHDSSRNTLTEASVVPFRGGLFA